MTNPVGRFLTFRLYTLSDYTNQTQRQVGLTNLVVTNVTTNTTTTIITNVTTNPITTNISTNLITNSVTNIATNLIGVTRQTFSNDLVTFRANFTNPPAIANLGTSLGLNGLCFDPTNGILSGTPTTNFVLTISNPGIEVLATNLVWSVTNNFSNNILASTATSTVVTNLYTNNSSHPSYRLVFQAAPVITFTNTNMAANTTNRLPITNNVGLNYTYTNLSGPGYVTNNTNLVATNAGVIRLQVAIDPGASGDNAKWLPVTNQFLVLATNPPAEAFGFLTDTNTNSFTATNLTYLGTTPLVFSNQGEGEGRLTLFLSRPEAGRFFVSNNVTYLQALSGSGSLDITAIRPATSTSALTTRVLTATLNRASNPIVLTGDLASSNITVEDPGVTSLALRGSVKSGRLSFSCTNTNFAQITNGPSLRLLANGTSTVVVTVVGANTTDYLPADPVTRTVVVKWPDPAAPVFTSANLQNGTVGSALSYTLSATASNTNAFPITYGATNLPAGLVFNGTNLISGTPTQAGTFRIQLTAANGGGVSTNILTCTVAPSTAFSAAQFWTNRLGLGTGTNTNGSYTFTPSLPAGLGVTTNRSSSAPPILLLTNANTNPLLPGWFAGVTNLSVVFSNSQAIFTSTVSLDIRPPSPALTIPSSVTGSFGIPLSLTGAVSPAALAGVSGYPLTFRANGLPAGLSLNATSGVIAGIPESAGSTTASVWVSNALGSSATSPVEFNIRGLAGSPVRMTVAFTNVPGIYAVPNLPPGLILNPASGWVTGSPDAVGTFALTVRFIRAGTTNTTNQTLTILPPVPIPKVPASLVIGKVGQPFYFQPWVTGPGWGWAGADPLTNSTISTNWTNRLLVGGSTTALSSNRNGTIQPTTNGLTFINNTNFNDLFLLWQSNLPSSWPWQAFLRLRIPGSLTNSNGYAYPVLGAMRARTAYPPNYLDDYADGGLLAQATNGVLPWSYFFSTNATNVPGTVPAPVGTNEVVIRFRFETNAQALLVAANTNPVANLYVGLTTNPNLAAEWSLTNPAAAFRLALGSSFSNQPVASNQILLRGFAVLPQGVGFYASNLPPGLACDPEAGTIFGTPTNTFTGLIYLYATNAQGTNSTAFRLRVLP